MSRDKLTRLSELRASITAMGGDVSHLSDEQLEEHALLFSANVARLGELFVTALGAFGAQAYQLGLLEVPQDGEET